jgi:crotonobetainyl-CoA:carnitine CoA-transferase CaiB-like acyl-CoA transferase
MTLPLEGVRVVDFSEHYFVPASAAVLAEWGADVIKIERREGDALRDIGHLPEYGFSYYFALCNRNKRGIALDVEVPAGREIFERLVRDADVYITNHLPRVQRRLRTTPTDVFALNPQIVYARGSGQGQRGPDAELGGNDNLAYWSRSGVAHMLSDESGDIIPQRGAIGDGPSGIALAAGILAALFHAKRTGTGVEVNGSLFGMGMWTVAPDIALTSLTGQVPERRPAPCGDSSMPRGAPLSSRYVTADGRPLALSMTNEARYWPRVCKALGLDDLIDMYADPAERRARVDELLDRFALAVGAMTAEQAVERLRAEDCVFGFINSPLDVLSDAQAQANGYLLAHPQLPSLKLPAVPAQFDDSLPRIVRGAPSLGEHSEEIVRELGYSPESIRDLVADGVIGAISGAPLH